MIIAEPHSRESERLEELASYSIMDSLEEEDYDNLTSIAASICGTPIALISLVDKNRQWFKSHHGLNVSQTPRDHAFCAHAINEPNTFFEIQDSRKDERFHDNPLATGDPHVIFYAGVPLIGENGLPLGTLCVIDNVPRKLSSDQKKSLDALSKQVMNLISLRRNKLMLESYISQLEEVNQNLERFATIAAHDLKSPLNNINSLVDLFKEQNESKISAEDIQILEMISTSSTKLKQLIDGLLRYSKAALFLGESRELISLRELVDEFSEILVTTDDVQIELVSDIDELLINRTVLYHILINLVSNAIKYGDKELTKIKISCNKEKKDFRFKVEDNGPGIPVDSQAKIFEMFRVLKSSDKFGNPGSGIGLAMVKKLVQNSGGVINITSTVNEGTSFEFTLPR